MTPEQQKRELGQPTFLQRNMSPTRRLISFGKDVGAMTAKGVGLVGETIDRGLGLPGRIATGFDSSVPQGFSEQVGEAVGQSTGNRTLGTVAGFAAGMASPGGSAKKAKQAVQISESGYKVLEDFLDHTFDVSRKKQRGNALVDLKYKVQEIADALGLEKRGASDKELAVEIAQFLDRQGADRKVLQGDM